jgi:alpha-L-fucosidase
VPASAFDPDALDTDEWAQVAKDMGAYSMVLTVKHEGGFCLWPTNQSDYSISASPFAKTGRDIVAEFVASCRKYGLRPGFYIAPTEDGWTMQQKPKINSSAFVAKELAMYRELLTGRYGRDIERTWWDHYPDGCGMSASGGFRSSCPKGAFPSAYPSFIEAVRKMAPQLLITNGPDAGNARAPGRGNGNYPVWNTCSLDPQFPASMKVCKSYGPGLPIWQPRQTPDSIQNDGRDWFWHPGANRSVMSASHIWERWLMTVGGGSHYLLNVPPNSSGLIPDTYAAAVKQFGDGLRNSIGSPVAQLANHSGPCSTPVVLNLPALGGTRAVDLIQVREDVRQHGQKIAKYALEALEANGSWTPLSVEQRPGVPNEDDGLIGGTPPLQVTVGHRVVDLLKEPLRKNVTAVRFRCLLLANGSGDDVIHIASILATARPTFT